MSSSGRILLVEADGILVKILQPVLESCGLFVDGVRSLKEAVDYIQRNSPGLIVMDVDLSASISAEKACQLIKKIPRCSATPIIIVAGEFDDLTTRIRNAGAQAGLTKPFTPRSFFRLLGEREDLLAQLTVSGREDEGMTAALEVTRDAFQKSDSVSPVEDSGLSELSGAKADGSILIIDDSRFLTNLLVDVFRRIQVDCRAASTVAEGASAIKEGLPSVVFIDLNLPDMQGDEACRFLRTVPACHDLPIYLMSAATEDELSQRSRACGADGFVRKPFTAEEFVQFALEKGLIKPGAKEVERALDVDSSSSVEESSEAPSFDLSIAETLEDEQEFVISPLEASFTDVPIPDSVPSISSNTDALPEPIGPSEESDCSELELELDDLPAVLLDPAAIVEDDAGSMTIDEGRLNEGLARLESHVRAGKLENRLEAILSIGRRQVHQGINVLIELVEAGDEDVLAEACWSLGELRDSRALPALISMLNRRELLFKSRALEAMGKVGDRAVIPHVVACLADAADELKLPIVKCLGKLGGSDAVKVLSFLADDYNRDVSREAREALQRLGDDHG